MPGIHSPPPYPISGTKMRIIKLATAVQLDVGDTVYVIMRRYFYQLDNPELTQFEGRLMQTFPYRE